MRVAREPDFPLRNVTDAEVEEYERNGVVRLSGIFQEAWVDRIAAILDRIVQDPSCALGRHVPEAAFIGDQFVWKLFDDFRDFVYLSPAARVAGTFMRSSRVRLFQDHLFIKPKECSVATPWHHDHTFFPIRGGPLCSIWLALSEVSAANGSLEFVRGSHRWPNRFKAVRPDRLHYFLESDFDDVPDIDAARSEFDVVRWDLEPGDILVFDSLTLHAAGPNLSTTHRCAYATRWCTDSLFYEPRHATSHFRWNHGLAPGDALSGPLFPQILPDLVEGELGLRSLGPEPPDPELTRLNSEAYAKAEERARRHRPNS